MSLPQKELFRVSEVADYFSVRDATIYLWIEHGHLKAVRPGPGKLIRVERESIVRCKFNKNTEEEKPEEKGGDDEPEEAGDTDSTDRLDGAEPGQPKANPARKVRSHGKVSRGKP